MPLDDGGGALSAGALAGAGALDVSTALDEGASELGMPSVDVVSDIRPGYDALLCCVQRLSKTLEASRQGAQPKLDTQPLVPDDLDADAPDHDYH